jgi:two-component sensor histidine kinase/DNA-binding response OmpR family regulator
METKSIDALLVEDSAGDARLIAEMLADAEYSTFRLSHVERLSQALQRLDQERFDLILLDLSLPDAQGFDTFERVHQRTPHVPIMVLTGLDDQELAVRAVREGAQDYLVKGEFDSRLLVRSMQYAIERSENRAALRRARDELEQQVVARTADLAQTNEILHAEIAVRTRAEQALRKLNEELESRVLERTAALSETNVQLRYEIDERKRAEVESLQRNRELLSLQAAAAATASSLDTRFVLDTVTWEMANLLEVEGCTIFEWDQETNTLSKSASYPSSPWEQEANLAETIDLEEYPLKRLVLMDRRAQQLSDGQPAVDPAEQANMRKAGIKSMLMLPVVFQHRTVGLVELKDSRVERIFTDHEVSLAHLLANQAASAIENARLYEQAQQELARREEAERRITASLREKEVLLREIHHRVKNNLQVISSLLYLQSQNITAPEILEMFQDSQNRVRSMALVHEELYRTEDLAQIDFAEYIQELAGQLLRSYNLGPGAVSLSVDADNTALGVDAAVPCGLILNELLSNSLKHAFPALLHSDDGHGHAEHLLDQGPSAPARGEGSQIHVSLCTDADGLVQLRVADNGVGFPEELDFRKTESLGLQLVSILVNQLRGKVELHREGGTEFRITLNPA